MNNQFNVDYAYPGICTLCFKEVARFRGSRYGMKPEILSYLPEYRNVPLELDDGTHMHVTMCVECLENFDESKDFKKVMNSEIKGWEREIDDFLKWDSKRKDAYMNKHGKLKAKGFKYGKKPKKNK